MARILDRTTQVGAYGTRLLAELGHEVLRVEAPEGDALRRLEPHLGGTATAERRRVASDSDDDGGSDDSDRGPKGRRGGDVDDDN